jgi:exopolysaccharide biosynthesis predicted pyruvyltransferase EpsI
VPNLSPDTIFYIHGGGGGNYLWKINKVMDCLTYLGRNHPGVMILGPQTFYPDADSVKELAEVLARRPKGLTFLFTREKVSYEFLRNIFSPNVEIVLDHDTALNLTMSDLAVDKIEYRYRLYGFRIDKESKQPLRRDFFSIWIDPPQECRSFDEWLRIHAHAKEIVTNRLHSAIVGMILGKKVTLLPNSYHKNNGVWEYSLAERGVCWADDIKLTFAQEMISQNRFLRCLAHSYKVQRVTRFCHGAF